MGFALSLQKQAGENQRGNKYSSCSFFFCPSSFSLVHCEIPTPPLPVE